MLVRLFLCLSFSSCLFAQKYTPKQIVFNGYPQGTQAALLEASGIQPKTALGQPEINAAAQHLVDTGLFSDVRFGFDGQTLTFTLKAATGALPVGYRNFPWWNSEAITAALEAKVPLFHGTVIPESGLQAQLVTALTAMLAEKGVPQASVSAVKVEPMKTSSGADIPESVSFHIDAPSIEVGEVNLTGLTPEWTEPLGAIEKAAAGQPFDDGTQATLETAVKIVYHRQGYLDESMTGFAQGTPVVAGDKVTVPLTATIDEGPQYHLAALTLSGDVLMSQEEFAKRQKLHAGDVVNEDLLRETLASVATPYKAKGYLRSTIKAVPSFDRTHHTVRYDIAVVPGDVYHMGKLEIVNLSDDKKALVLKNWTMHAGDVFDATYTSGFLNKNAKTLHALDGWSATYKQYEHEDTHIVDMVLTFHQGGPLN